jgi:hypothetical protein
MKDIHKQPAFAHTYLTQTSDGDPVINGYTGMTLLDYYICHAPAKPWKHFKPQMRGKPEEIWCLEIKGQRLEFATLGDLRVYCSGIREAVDADPFVDDSEGEAWETEYIEQRARQWPIYWAMRMLEQREKVS